MEEYAERIKLIKFLISALSHSNGPRMPCKRSKSLEIVSAICERIDCHEIEIEDRNEIAGKTRIQLYWQDKAAENKLIVFTEVTLLHSARLKCVFQRMR